MPVSGSPLPTNHVEGQYGHPEAHNATNQRVNDLQTQGNATETAVAGKAAASHTHTIGNVTGLQAALDAAGTGGEAVVDATTSVKGVARILGGTADAPTVPYASVTGKPAIPTVPGDIGAQPAGSYATATALTTGLAGKQDADSDLTGLAGLGDGNPVRTAGAWSVRSDAALASALGVSGSTNRGYLLAAFGPAERLSVYYSGDGKTFADPGMNPVFSGTAGSVVRDPSIIYLNGWFYVAHTRTTFTGTSWDVVRSSDLLTWTKMATVDMSSIGSVTNTWAPELVVDTNGDVYAFTSINQTTVYRQKATAADLSAWTAPTLVTFSGGPAAIIDPTFIRNGSTWYCFYKNEVAGQKLIERATSSTLSAATWTVDRTGDWAGWGGSVEGPSVVSLPDGRFRIYLDRYTGPGMHYSESADLNTWSTLTLVAVKPTLGLTLRHGTVLPLTNGDQVGAVIAAAATAREGRRLFPGVSGGYTMTLFDEGRVWTYDQPAGTNATVTLPASAPEGWSIQIAQSWDGRVTVNNNGDAGIKTSGGDATSVTTARPGQILTFTKDAGNRWYVTGLDGLPAIVSALPTASAAYRGQTRFMPGGTGVADVVYVCRKTAADAYEWLAMSGGGSTTPSITSPADVTSLYAWYKADAITGLSDGAAVASWVESQGTGANAIQGSSTLQPLYKTGIVNSQPVVRFDGTDDWLDAAPASASLANFTIFAVVRPSNNTGSHSITSCSGGGGLQLRVNNGFVIISKDGVTDAASGSTALSTTNFTIVEITVSASASTIRLNGTLDATGAGYTPTAGRTNRISRSGGEYWAGDIAEIVTYSTVLSVDNRTAVRGLLGTKYGITVV